MTETTDLRAKLNDWQLAMGVQGAQRLANRLGDVFSAAERVREQIVALASKRNGVEAASELVKLEVWMRDELGERIRDAVTLMEPVLRELGDDDSGGPH